MRALVFSDSHGRVQPMLDAVSCYRPDVLFHLGDVLPDGNKLAGAFPDIPLYQVAGNCDWGFSGDRPEKAARLGARTVFYLHGHTAQVKLGVHYALEKAEAIGADLLLFGHTHRPLCQRYGSLLAVNPGAVLDGSAALLLWEPGSEISCLHLDV